MTRGAGPLNVTFDPVSRHAFVADRGSGTITVVDTQGRIVANLDAGSFPNQLRADSKGNVDAVNKSRGENDEAGERVWRIHAKRSCHDERKTYARSLPFHSPHLRLPRLSSIRRHHRNQHPGPAGHPS